MLEVENVIRTKFNLPLIEPAVEEKVDVKKLTAAEKLELKAE